jgi:hypothetical protein
MTTRRILSHDGILWILESDDGKNQTYRHPTDTRRKLSVIDPTYTFQPSDADTFLNKNSPNTIYGTQTYLNVYAPATAIERSILKFDMTGQIPAGVIINSATLSLYYYTIAIADPVGRTYWVYRLTQTGWTQAGASWNYYVGTTAWATAGGDYTTTDGASVTMPAGFGWVAWTVTAQVQTAVDSVGRVAHFLVKDGAESSNVGASFYSNNYTTDTTKRPKLYVDWTVPPTPINVSESGAGSDVVVNIGISAAEAGTGTESAVSIEAALPIVETATGTDVATAEGPGLMETTEEGAAVDAVAITAAIDVPESGAGAEAFSATSQQGVSEAAVGSDACAIAGSIPVVETGAGTDVAPVEAHPGVTETCAGTETLTVSASIPSSESGVGVDAPAIQNPLTKTDLGLGSETIQVSTGIPVSESGAGAETKTVVASIPVIDSGHGVESSVYPATSLTVTESALGFEGVTTPGTLTVFEEGKGAEFAWRIKPSSPMIDALVLPHVLSIRISDPATMSDKKVQGGSLPRRTMMGKPGRIVDVEGWSDSRAEIDALKALCDGVRRTFYHPNGDSFGVLVTGFQPSRTVDQHNRRTYRLALAEAN